MRGAELLLGGHSEGDEGNLSARMLSYGDYAIPLLSLGLGLAGYWWLAKWRNRVEAFSSFKEAAKAKTANPNSRAAFKALRALFREYGVQKLEDELAAGRSSGWLSAWVTQGAVWPRGARGKTRTLRLIPWTI